ncbi:MAG: HD domain-containing protein [Bacteroidetes bacterium]|nr:HD domain-containing protein [Bacteroidota bacterium]
MTDAQKHKEKFLNTKSKLFEQGLHQKDSLKFSLEYSLLVEGFIRTIAGKKRYNFSLTSAGSFSRRELSPYSDIDIIFITNSLNESENDIVNLVQQFWDNGIEVSHTVRFFSDIKKYLGEDLHVFTQFFETRHLLGSKQVYEDWKDKLFKAITQKVKIKLFNELINDIAKRYKKYGDSPKVLEPNIKTSAGGLRDFQTVEWMYILFTKSMLHKQNELTQAEIFIDQLKKNKLTTSQECKRLIESYKLVLYVRNILHLIEDQKTDRFEFRYQKKIVKHLYNNPKALSQFMQEYFRATNVIYRFTKSMRKKFDEEISNSLPEALNIILDEQFVLKWKTISHNSDSELDLSDVMRAFYYRGLHTARFDESLRSEIVEIVEDADYKSETESSVFFREILKLPKNVGHTLSAMNELGVLGAFMPEFKDVTGFMQHGVYHCYTTDEHTIMTIKNLEKLKDLNTSLSNIYNSIKDKDILYLAMLFHDIAKSINIAGHEIIGAEMGASIMQRLGYEDDEIDKVAFLVKNHLLMEQVAFRRNLNDAETLDKFGSNFNTFEELEMLYLVTYADLSAVNSVVWTSWKSDLLTELFSKVKAMLEQKISGEEFLISKTYVIPKDISKFSPELTELNVQDHIESINDIGYTHHFSEEEIAKHIVEIEKGSNLSVLFNNISDFTNITIITKDFPALLSKLCGVMLINDLNIHDAKIFTRKDGIVIDTFNVSDFRTKEKINEDKYSTIENNFNNVINGFLKLDQEIEKLKTKWWRIEKKFFRRSGKIQIDFEKHDKYTILDIFSPDRLGFLFQVTNKMNELGLMIYFAKISTRGDDIVDSFYVLDREGKKISLNDYEFVKSELISSIEEIN